MLSEVEDIKSAVINDYDILKYIFDVYRARDKHLVDKKKRFDYNDSIADSLVEFE